MPDPIRVIRHGFDDDGRPLEAVDAAAIPDTPLTSRKVVTLTARQAIADWEALMAVVYGSGNGHACPRELLVARAALDGNRDYHLLMKPPANETPDPARRLRRAQRVIAVVAELRALVDDLG